MGIIAYQGVEGAYSHLACHHAFPDMQAEACETFDAAMLLVEEGKADLAMLPIENSTAGRVEEIYRLIPKMRLHIIGEHFEPVDHCLLGIKGTKLEDVRYVASHPQALAQCYDNIKSQGLSPHAKIDTALSAKEVKAYNDKEHAAIASSLAAELYELEILAHNFQDRSDNATRFLILSKHESTAPLIDERNYITSLIFQVKNMPAALYKALGGFATNNVNLIKIESYSLKGSMQVSQFHIDIDGHPMHTPIKNALDELAFFADDVRILGSYEPHSYRSTMGQ